MSASSEKKRRQEERAQGIDKRVDAQHEAAKKKATSKRNWTLGTIALALLLALIIVLNTSLPFAMTAVKVGDKNYSAAEMNYFYTNSYYNNYNTMSMLGVDFRRPVNTQKCLLMEDGTWRDYLIEDAIATARSMEAVYSDAMKNGYELSEEGKASVEENMTQLPDMAKANGFTSVKKYLRAVYGTGVTEDIVREMLTKATLVTEYANHITEGFTYTESEQAEYFNEHIDEFITYNYMYYMVNAETEEVTDEDGNTTTQVVEGGMEAAEAAAKEIAEKATDAAAFEAAVTAYKADTTVQTAKASLKANINAAYRDWVTDSARQAGDVTTISSDKGSYVVMYLGLDNQRYNSVNMRHILIQAVDADGDRKFSEEEQKIAEDKIKEIEQEWLAGEKTAEAFAALADKYTEDMGSKGNGGLYENVGKGTMVPEIDEFLYATKHKTGDTTIVHGNNGGYDGYHLVYFAGEGKPYNLALAENAMVNEAYSEWHAGLMENVSATTTFAARFIGK